MRNNLLLIGFGRVSQMLIMFLTYRVLSTVFTVEDMGGYYFLLSIASGFGLLMANPLGVYSIRKLNNWKKSGALVKNLSSLLMIFIVGSFFTAPLLFIYREKIASHFLSLNAVVVILIFYVFASTIHGTLVPLLNLLEETTHFVWWTFVTSVLGLVLSFFIVHYIAVDPMLWLFGQSVAFALIAGVVYFILIKKFTSSSIETENHKVFTENNIKKVLFFSLPIVLTNVFVWIMSQSFRFFLKDNVSATILGEMVFGLGLATTLSVSVEYLFQQLFLPKYYKNISDETVHRGKEWGELFNNLIPLYIYLLFYLFSLSPFILRVLADAKFKNSSTFFALGAIVEFFRITGNVFNMANQSEMKMHKSILPYMYGGIVTLTGVFIICKYPDYVNLIPHVLIAGYVVINLALYANMRKILEVEINTKQILKSILLGLIFLSSVAFWGFSGNLIYSIIICFIFGLYFLYLLYTSYQNVNLQRRLL